MSSKRSNYLKKHTLNHLFSTPELPLKALWVQGKEGKTPYKWSVRYAALEEWHGHALIAIAGQEQRTVSSVIKDAINDYLIRKIQEQAGK